MNAHLLSPTTLRRVIRATLARTIIGAVVAVGFGCTLGLGTATADIAVTATPSQVAAQLFVAGDVARLSAVPSGTESLVLEKVLQQLYTQNPSLSPSDAANDIEGLESALASPGAPTAATLTVMPGNQRILTILDALETSAPPTPVAVAITAVARDALTQSSAALAQTGVYFDASADTLSTLSLADFSPAQVLADTATLAADNPSFAQARDTLWAAVSHEHVLDDTQQLLDENPALQNGSVQALVADLSNGNGSFSSDETALESMISGDETQIEDQTCTPVGSTVAPGSGQQPNCSSGALHDAELVAAACPSGVSSSDPACQSAVSSVAGDGQREANAIAAEQAAATAAAGLLGYANAQLQVAEQADAQAAAQVANEENAYLTYSTAQNGLKLGEDVISLGVSLSVSEIDPVVAIQGLFSVINDAVGFGQQDPNQIILTGIQNISQQITEFEQYTQSAFTAISSQLGALSSQIAQQTYALSVQLTNAQDQISQLSGSISSLQSSVDQLQSEVQSLFATGANNDLLQVTSENLGYETVNGTPLPAGMFSTAADDLFHDATDVAQSETVLAAPGPFDAFDASTQLNDGGSDPLNTNINYLNYFPQLVSDGPTGPFTSAPLSPGCAASATPLCLPNPAFWASSSRGFAQLLLENPQDVTPARLTQLQTLITEGASVQSALAQISANDAGSDPGGTGSKLLDGLLAYYQNWATGTGAAGEPSLQQALINEESAYLSSQQVPSEGISYAGVHPWDGIEQLPDFNGLLAEPQFQNVKVCDPSFTSANGDTTLPALSQTLLQYVPFDLLNAARVGVGNITVCWTASFDNGSPGQGNVGDLDLSLIFFGNVPMAGNNGNTYNQPYEIAYLNSDQPVTDDYNGDGISDAVATVTQDWQSPYSPIDLSTTLAPVSGAIPPENLTAVSAYDDPLTQNILTSLQQGVYNAILAGGDSLTTGTSAATDVMAAAQRLNGASALLADYVRLGFSQALASDDNLQQLVNGAKSDVFAYPGVNLFGTATLDGVQAQLIRYYQQAEGTPGVYDPAVAVDGFTKAVSVRVKALRAALASYVQTGRASGQTPSDGGGPLAESSPVVASTLARLRLSETVLSEELSGALSIPGFGTTATGTTTTGTTTTGTTTTGTTTTSATTTGTTTNPTPSGTSPTTPATIPEAGGSATSATARVLTLTVRCRMHTCHDHVIVTVTERLRGHKLLAVGMTARTPKGETNRTITAATTTFTLAPGRARQVTLTLNATGRALLLQFGRLPITITVTQQQRNNTPRSITILSRTLQHSTA